MYMPWTWTLGGEGQGGGGGGPREGKKGAPAII